MTKVTEMELEGRPSRPAETEAAASSVETPPILAIAELQVEEEIKRYKGQLEDDGISPIWVEWEPADPANPYNWSLARKWFITSMGTAFTLVVAWSGSSFPFGNSTMIPDLNCSRDLAALAFGMFPLGFGLAPLVLAPFSEAYGRYPMYVLSSFLYAVTIIPTALAKNIETVVILRLLTGFAASPGSTIVGGTIADMFETSQRGPPMALFSVGTMVGTGLGPALMGWVGEKKDWRYIQWINLAIAIALFICATTMTRETRGSVLLSKKAKKLRKETGNQRYACKSDAERESLLILVKYSLTRPLYLLFTEPIVAAFSLWVGFCWGIMYLSLQAASLIFENVYGFTVGQTGSVFWVAVLGAFFGSIGNYVQEQLYRKNHAKKGPEARLYASLVAGLLFPAGLFIFGFAQGRGHWMGPVIGLLLVYISIFTIYLATFNYLADSYTLYASSALTGQSLCRNLCGTVFPLFTYQMYGKLGYQWASFLAGMLGLVLAITPVILLKLGPRIRAASRFAKELERMEKNKAK